MTKIRYFTTPEGKYLPLTGGTINGGVNINGGVVIQGQETDTVALTIDSVINAGPAYGTMLKIINYDNDVARKVIDLIDENNNEDFYIQTSPTKPLMYCRGAANINSLQIGGTEVIDSSRNAKNLASITSSGVGDLGSLKIGGTEVIDSSRNIVNVGTVDGVDISGIVPCLTVLDDTILSSNATSYTFSNLDINTHKIYKIYLLIKNASTSTNTVYIDINGDSTASNYYYQRFIANGTSVTAARAASNWVGTVRASDRAPFEITVLRNENNEGWWFVNGGYGVSSNIEFRGVIGYHSNTGSNITSITIRGTQSNGFASGSRFIIMGMKS